jgi:purine-nucleoside phosphorylase
MAQTPPNAPTEAAARAAADITAHTGIDHFDAYVTLGSGWSEAARLLGEPVATVPFSSVHGFASPQVGGHAGNLLVVRAGANRALVAMGRTHLYEGRGVDAVVHGVRTAAALGVRTVVLTNGCGGVDASMHPGEPVLISDHLNLTGTSPLTGPVFVDLTEAYSSRLRAVARAVDPSLREGVYAQFRGPQYETPAEVRMARALGADLVGMSTALEAICARSLGLEVLGVSLVTNLAAGVSPTPLDHHEVLAAGAQAAPRLGALLAAVLRQL